MSGFFSGSLDPFWPHALLLTAAVVASFAVAAGIVLENPKWSLANVLVVGGVAIEAACTLLLFGFDEGISSTQRARIDAQQSKIVALEEELAPRTINDAQMARIVGRLKPLFAGRRVDLFVDTRGATPDTFALGARMSVVLANSGLRLKSWQIVAGPASRPGISVQNRVGIGSGPLDTLSQAIVSALTVEGLVAAHDAPLGDETEAPGATYGPPWDPRDVAGVRVTVGSKPDPTDHSNVGIIQQAN